MVAAEEDRAALLAVMTRYVGLDRMTIGIDRFGLSAPGDVVMKELGLTAPSHPSHHRENPYRSSGLCAWARSVTDFMFELYPSVTRERQ